jgi:uncharacterized protein
MAQSEEVRRRFQAAVESLVEKVRRDPHLIAAVLWGSLSYDEVWEKSDIDLWLIGRDEKSAGRSFVLVEEGVTIHACLQSRSKFRQMLEKSLQGSFIHSAFSRSTLLYSSDDSLAELFESARRLGARDRETQLLRAAAEAVQLLNKVEKWLFVKEDPLYSFVWFMAVVSSLATIETLLHDEIPMREVIHQALRHNPEFFGEVYTGLVQRPKDRETMERAIGQVHTYLAERRELLFRPVLEYLHEARGIRSTTELDDHFRKQTQSESMTGAYEWLAEQGVIQRFTAPVRLTEKSRVAFEEAAYHYERGA